MRRRLLLCLSMVLLAVSAPVAAAAGAAPAAYANERITADVCGYEGPLPPPSSSELRVLVCYLNHAMDPARWPPLPWPIDRNDPRLRNRVLAFQRCAGLPADGVVGPQTWYHLRYWANSGRYVC